MAVGEPGPPSGAEIPIAGRIQWHQLEDGTWVAQMPDLETVWATEDTVEGAVMACLEVWRAWQRRHAPAPTPP